MPTDLHWIKDVREGRLAIMARPRAGDWLGDELTAWKREGVDVVVSLLETHEIEELGLEEEPELCQKHGLVFLAFPIPDRGVPASVDEFLAFIDELAGHLSAGRSVAIHCRMGIGRSSLMAASLLVRSGHSAKQAFRAISRDRGMEVPDTKRQIEWVESLAALE